LKPISLCSIIPDRQRIVILKLSLIASDYGEILNRTMNQLSGVKESCSYHRS